MSSLTEIVKSKLDSSDTVSSNTDQTPGRIITTGYDATKLSGLGSAAKLQVDDLFLRSEFNSLSLMGAVDYGEITLPDDFQNNIDFNLWRDASGEIKHDFDISLKTFGYTQYYLSQFGNEANDGLTPSTARKSLKVLMDDIEADPNVTSARIDVISDYMTRDYFKINLSWPRSKNYYITAGNPTNRVCVGDIERGLSWSLHSVGTYVTTRTFTEYVYDSRYKSFHGLPYQLKKAETLTECENTKGTWYTVEGSVYVHLFDDTVPDNNLIYLVINDTAFQYTFSADSLFILSNFNILNGGADQACYFAVNGTTTQGNVILNAVKVSGGRGGGNGIATNGIKSIWSFDCAVREVGADGFNYHNYIDGDTFAFEYNCIAEKCGEIGGYNNNATTAHEGMRILRVATKGGQSQGPVLADVNGCYSICYDCEMGESLRVGGGTKASFYFDNEGSELEGKAILINCSGGSKSTFGINGDVSFKSSGNITVKNFRGSNVPTDIDLNIL